MRKVSLTLNEINTFTLTIEHTSQNLHTSWAVEVHDIKYVLVVWGCHFVKYHETKKS